MGSPGTTLLLQSLPWMSFWRKYNFSLVSDRSNFLFPLHVLQALVILPCRKPNFVNPFLLLGVADCPHLSTSAQHILSDSSRQNPCPPRRLFDLFLGWQQRANRGLLWFLHLLKLILAVGKWWNWNGKSWDADRPLTAVTFIQPVVSFAALLRCYQPRAKGNDTERERCCLHFFLFFFSF